MRCSRNLATYDLETEVFLHVLHNCVEYVHGPEHRWGLGACGAGEGGARPTWGEYGSGMRSAERRGQRPESRRRGGGMRSTQPYKAGCAGAAYGMSSQRSKPTRATANPFALFCTCPGKGAPGPGALGGLAQHHDYFRTAEGGLPNTNTNTNMRAP